MDPERNPRRAKTGSKVLVVTERLVLRLAAAAKGGARQGLNRAVLMLDIDLADHEKGPVADRCDRGWTIGILVRRAIQPPVKECATRASAHDLGHLVCAGHIGQSPRAPIELEDSWLAAQTLADVDADVKVEADFDVPPAIDLPHPLTIRAARIGSRAGGGSLTAPRLAR